MLKTRATVLIGLLLAQGTHFASAAWTLEDALKQMEKALKGVSGMTGDAETVQATPQGETKGTGRVSIRPESRMRLEIPGDNGWVLLWNLGEVQVYRPADGLVEIYDAGDHPEKLPQYAALGFITVGRDLKKDYRLTLIAEATLDDRKVLMLELTPKDAKVRAAVARVHIWVDVSTWLPARQEIVLSAPDTSLTIRYRNVVRDDAINKDLFKANWPQETKTVRE